MTTINTDTYVNTNPGVDNGGAVSNQVDLKVSKGIADKSFDEQIAYHEKAACSSQPYLTDPSLEPSTAVLKDCQTALSQMDDASMAIIELSALLLKERRENKDHAVASTMNAYHTGMAAAAKADKAADKRRDAAIVAASLDAVGHLAGGIAQFGIAGSSATEATKQALSAGTTAVTSLLGDAGKIIGAEINHDADMLDGEVKRDTADVNRETAMAEAAHKAADEEAQLLQSAISQLNKLTDQAYNTERDQIRPA